MAILDILHYPDPRLRNVAQPVQVVDETIVKLVDDMLETMYEAPGIGLAAVQVNVPKRIIVIDVSDERNQPVVLINPQILEHIGEVETEEGCLSVPGIYENVTRPEHISVRALDKGGEPIEFQADGLLSVCIQHECDHLEGRLFVDYLSRLKRHRIRKKAERQAKQAD